MKQPSKKEILSKNDKQKISAADKKMMDKVVKKSKGFTNLLKKYDEGKWNGK